MRRILGVWAVLFGASPAFSANPLLLIRSTATVFLVRIPIANAGNQYAEWTMQNLQIGGSNNWRMEGVSIKGPATNYVLASASIGDVWEYAYEQGITNDTVGNFGFIGGGHGNETMTSYTLTADGTDETGLAVGTSVTASSVVFSQAGNTLLPKDGTTQIGTFTLTHTFGSSNLTVTHSHTYMAGYQLFNGYGMTMTTSNDVNTLVVGSGTPHTIVQNGMAYFLSVIPSPVSAQGYSTGQPYSLTLTLPNGGPENSVLFSLDTGPEYFWCLDELAPLTYAKCYANWAPSQYANRITPPSTSSHTAVYSVAYSGTPFTGSSASVSGAVMNGATIQ